jgi:hypothetical protein
MEPQDYAYFLFQEFEKSLLIIMSILKELEKILMSQVQTHGFYFTKIMF